MQKLNYQLTVIIGDVDKTTSACALSHDSTAFLIDFKNYKQFLNSKLEHNTTVYTSLGDLPKDISIAWQLLTLADIVIYSPPTEWSDRQTIDPVYPGSSIQGLTENLLLRLPPYIKVQNFNQNNLVPNPIPLADKRQSDGPQLWSVGCSFTHGVGVAPTQRYGHLISKALKMPCSFLTRPVSAIDWAADQIIRSDIRAGDIVIWGITGNERMTFVHDNKLAQGVTLTTYEQTPKFESILPIKTILSQNTFYTHIYSIERVINFCKKCQARLIMFGILTSESTLRYLAGNLQYYHFYHDMIYNKDTFKFQFKDLGTDQIHPGPNQHEQYKNFILNLL